MSKRPNNNLPPESQPWARSVETDIANIQRSVQQLDTYTKNSFASINSTLVRMGDQIQDTVLLTPVSMKTPTGAPFGFPVDTGVTPLTYTFTPPPWARSAHIQFHAYMSVAPIGGHEDLAVFMNLFIGPRDFGVPLDYRSMFATMSGTVSGLVTLADFEMEDSPTASVSVELFLGDPSRFISSLSFAQLDMNIFYSHKEVE